MSDNNTCIWHGCESYPANTINIVDAQENGKTYHLCNEHYLECMKTENLHRIAEMVGDGNERQ